MKYEFLMRCILDFMIRDLIKFKRSKHIMYTIVLDTCSTDITITLLCYHCHLLIPIFICSCADATREVLKNADYHQLKFNSPDGKEGYIVYPKDFDDLIRERIKGGEIKLAVTGTS